MIRDPDERWDWLMDESQQFRELNDLRENLVLAGMLDDASLIEWWQWEIVELHNRLARARRSWRH